MKPLSLPALLIAASLFVSCWPGGANAYAALSETSPSVSAPQSAKSPAAKPPPPSASRLETGADSSSAGPKEAVLSSRVAEYHIDVRLDPESDTLKGTETVTWTHPGRQPVKDLYFHLYPNAFASADTTFMKESGGKLREDKMPAGGYGSMTLTDIRTSDGEPLLHRLQYVQPDDGNPHDRTLAKVHLPRQVTAGESVTLRLQFEVKLPRIFARMGAAGDFVMAGQWFPKLSAYEPRGVRGTANEGWNLHQYHGSSEFYSDFGIYNVTISVPSDYKVAATGFPVRTASVKNGIKSYRFYADDVHDFAWAASPRFVVAEEALSTPEVPGVRIKLYLDPMHKDLKERYFQAAKSALTYFSKWYGPYPYSTLTVVVPPLDGNGAGGMEYPTLVTAFGASDPNPDSSLERTVIHEIAHQYFYGMIASNEFEEAWLDESFASYAEDRLMEQEYGAVPNLPLQAGFVTSPAPLKLEAWKYGGADIYTQNVYLRGKLVLKDIERQTGRKTMDRIMRTYAEKYRFRHPTTRDFQQVVEQVTRKPWQSYFDQYVYSGGTADFAIDSIQINRDETDGAASYESVVQIGRKGAEYPAVPVRFTFADGRTLQKQWDGTRSGTTFRLRHTAPLVHAEIDPDRTLLLETKHWNNFRKAELDPKTASRWTLGVAKFIETVLGILSW
ncbi:M1 family metallopeptidase [Paenibacillus sp. CN-4]|uniref:M1 family metallopeptidase n=1 Tax=Paenibacillus nanchangensis TaxID=3348343 RepID=UPI00397DF9F2